MNNEDKCAIMEKLLTRDDFNTMIKQRFSWVLMFLLRYSRVEHAYSERAMHFLMARRHVK